MTHIDNLVARLRDTANNIRRKPTALAEVIPMLQEAADQIEVHRVTIQVLADQCDALLGEVAAEREACAKLAELAEPYQTADLIRKRGKA